MRLAIDVMGGDHAPDGILEGCLDGLSILAPEDRLVLVGDQRVIEELLTQKGVTDPRLEIEHASEVINMDDAPAKAVRSKPDSSIVKMARLGSSKAEQPVDGVLSAGNTGACVSAAIMQMRRLPGVHRPGICVTIPALPRAGRHVRRGGQPRAAGDPPVAVCPDGRGLRPAHPRHREPSDRADEHRQRGGQGHRHGQGGQRPAPPDARGSTTSASSRGVTSSAARWMWSRPTASWATPS